MSDFRICVSAIDDGRAKSINITVDNKFHECEAMHVDARVTRFPAESRTTVSQLFRRGPDPPRSSCFLSRLIHLDPTG